MALIRCTECGTDISDKAAACVKCGAPIEVARAAPAPRVNQPKKKRKSGCLAIFGWGFLIIVGLSVLGSIFGGSDPKKSDPKVADAPPAPAVVPAPPSPYGAYDGKPCGKDDLDCRGNGGIVGASVYCKSPIEHMATHSVKWTDGTFEMKFSRFRFTDTTHETLTFVGDKAEFQNGFGAYTPVVYRCTMANDHRTVTNVVVNEGRLPDD